MQQGTNLTHASRELFSRPADHCFPTMDDLHRRCTFDKKRSRDLWSHGRGLQVSVERNAVSLGLDGEPPMQLTDWSFSQLCQLAGVSKDTLNRLTPDTAAQVFRETLPHSAANCGKPIQMFVADLSFGPVVRSIHRASYTRVFDTDLLSMVREYATDFIPPQASMPVASGDDTGTRDDDASDDTSTGEHRGTGLYRGEQDMFVFLIDPTGWIEIEGQAFAPGFFLWNSEVGRRSIGVKTFWFQAVCKNHIVWDAVDVTTFTRKHTANVHESFSEIRQIIERLVAKRDDRRDGFAKTIENAMRVRLGDDTDDVMKVLAKHGITRSLAKQALQIAEVRGMFTIFSLVDAITQLAGRCEHAGQRAEIDVKAGQLLALAK